jgi:hypothetical protein
VSGIPAGKSLAFGSAEEATADDMSVERVRDHADVLNSVPDKLAVRGTPRFHFEHGSR